MRSMQYICKYKTPEGFDDLVMCGDGEALTGLWFEGSRDDWRNTHGESAAECGIMCGIEGFDDGSKA